MSTLNNKILIPGTIGYYVSEDGKVFSTNYRGGDTMYELKTRANNCGYHQVKLGANGGIVFGNKLCSVHRLVATAFIPNPEGKPQVNHINGNKADNSVTNLEWNTASENQLHATEVGLRTTLSGEDVGGSKITNELAELLIQDLLNGSTNEVAASKFNLHSRYVSLVRHKKRWAWLWESKFPGQEAPNSVTDLKAGSLDRDLVMKELLTTTESCRAIATRHNIDQSVLSRIRKGSKIAKIWQPYVDKYINIKDRQTATTIESTQECGSE